MWSPLSGLNWNVTNRMNKAGQGLPTDYLYSIASAHTICPSKPSVFAMLR